MRLFRSDTLPYPGRRPFYGWVIVFVGFISQAIQGLVVQGFSAYADLLHTEFGWSRATLAGPRSVTSVENSLLGPLSGFLLDKFGPRRVVAVGVTVTGVGLILLGSTHALWMYYVSNIVMALGLSLGGMMVMSVAVNSWFRRRATVAQSIMLLGYSLAGVLGVPLLVRMQTAVGWRETAVWSGVAVIVVGLPCSLLLRTRPEPFGLVPDGAAAAAAAAGAGTHAVENDLSMAQALRTSSFWLLGFEWAACMLATGVVQVHIFLQMAQDVGLSRPVIATVWSIASLCNIPFRLIGGFLGDRIPRKVALGIAIGFMGISVIILSAASSFGMALLFAVPYGIGWGISTPVINAIQGEYFGRKAQGVIRGWIQMVGLPFSIAGPVLVGYIADVQGTYRWALLGMAVIILVGAALAFVTNRPGLAGKSEPVQTA
jgi:MFS transporter, OFA family, oxalate/formate antiporter